MKKRLLITFILVVVSALLLLQGNYRGSRKGAINYPASLDEVAVSVDGRDLTLRDLAFYVAYEEQEVQLQACEYNPEDTSKYWNVHVSGMFVKVAARNAAIQMAIHDEIFYRMAMQEGITLSEEEEQALLQAHRDFWADLVEDEQVQRLGVSEEELQSSIRKMMYAQKYQSIYSQMEEESYEDYDFNGKRYEEMKNSHEIKINEDLWSRVDIGNITLTHEKETETE